MLDTSGKTCFLSFALPLPELAVRIFQLRAELRHFVVGVSILQPTKRKAAKRHALRHWPSPKLCLGTGHRLTFDIERGVLKEHSFA